MHDVSIEAVPSQGPRPPTSAAIHRRIDDATTASPVVDVVVPVYNEAHVVAASVQRLHTYLGEHFPFSWRISIVDNASTDGTWYESARLARDLPHVRALHLDEQGRGLALRTAWSGSDAQIVAYTDVDLSTDLAALLPLVAPLISRHSDISIGSRLIAGATVARRPGRELLSRAYNALLRTVLNTRVHDAQCGFKAARADVMRSLLPAIRDNGWFFDTELLLLAEHNGLRIHEVPVDWIDDGDSRVHVARTIMGDLAGTARMAREFATGTAHVDVRVESRQGPPDDFGRGIVRNALVGAATLFTAAGVLLVTAPALGPLSAAVLAAVAGVLIARRGIR